MKDIKQFLKLFFRYNFKKYFVYFITLIATLIIWAVTSRKPDDLVIPPIPEPEWPDFDNLGLLDARKFEQLVKDHHDQLEYKSFAQTPAGLVALEELIANNNADAPLYRLANNGRRSLGLQPIPTRSQGRLGICVGCGAASACEFSMAATAQITKKFNQQLPFISEEAIYGFSRYEIHGNKRPQGLTGDGSLGIWAARALETKGVLERRNYPNIVDLTKYQESIGRLWGDNGVPDSLEPIALNQTAISVTPVRTTGEAIKALHQGYAIYICSNVGFAQRMPITRDPEGFLRPQGVWNHCMVVIGYRAGNRPGFLILNSWGTNWVNGPKGTGWDDIPDGSFWCETAVMQNILSQGDSFAVSGVKGFPRRRIDPKDWIAMAR